MAEKKKSSKGKKKKSVQRDPEKDAEMNQLLAAFSQLDTSGDARLGIDEFTTLLRRGDPSMTDFQIRALFEACDEDHNGTIDFQEFVHFVYSPPEVQDAKAPPEIQNIFINYAGQDGQVDGSELAKMCKELGLLNKKFKMQDVDTVFARAREPNQRKIGYEQFEQVLLFIALRQGVGVKALHEQLAGKPADGPSNDDVALKAAGEGDVGSN